jgi:hypothetical protein
MHICASDYSMYDVTIFSESPLFTMVHEALYFDGPTVLRAEFANEEAWQIRLSKMDNIRSAADFVVTNYADTTRLSLERRQSRQTTPHSLTKHPCTFTRASLASCWCRCAVTKQSDVVHSLQIVEVTCLRAIDSQLETAELFRKFLTFHHLCS